MDPSTTPRSNVQNQGNGEEETLHPGDNMFKDPSFGTEDELFDKLISLEEENNQKGKEVDDLRKTVEQLKKQLETSKSDLGSQSTKTNATRKQDNKEQAARQELQSSKDDSSKSSGGIPDEIFHQNSMQHNNTNFNNAYNTNMFNANANAFHNNTFNKLFLVPPNAVCPESTVRSSTSNNATMVSEWGASATIQHQRR